MRERWGHPPWPADLPPWAAPLPYIRSPSSHFSLTPPREGYLSPFRISPWSRISEIHVPSGFFWKDLLLPLLRWSEGAELVGVPGRVCDQGCTAALRC